MDSVFERVLKHLNENGFLLLNEDPDYPSICSMGGGWPDLIELIRNGDAFLTSWVKNKRTLISRSVYQSFQRLKCTSYKMNSCELSIIKFLETNGSTDISQLHTCLPYSKKELVKAITSLQNRLLVAVTDEAKSLTKQWGIYLIDLSAGSAINQVSAITKMEAQEIIRNTFSGVLNERQLTKLTGRHVQFPKYYQAYDGRYRRVHAEHMLWFLDQPTPEVMEWLRVMDIDKADPICEIGCGEGRDALHLAGLGYCVNGVDISEEAIRTCQQRALEKRLEVTWDRMDLAAPTFKTAKSYKWLYTIATLHMLTEATDRKVFLVNLYAMLEPGGSLMLVNKGDGVHETHNQETDAFQLVERTHIETGKKLMLPATSFYQATWVQMESEVLEAGFTIVQKLLTENENYGQCMTMYLTR